MSFPEISPAAVRQAFLLGAEIALIDAREEAPYALDHPLFAAQLSVTRLELDAFDRLPRRDVAIVVYDDGEGLAERLANGLAALGFSDISLMAGGLKGWRDAGFELFQDVNSASKAFGELVESRRHTPSIAAEAALAAIRTDPNLVVLDARRYDEYKTMSIPRGVSVPGAELVLRAPQIAGDPTTTIIVNCAGRTRSIIGAQSLINAGVPNPVVALRNGAIGWQLAGQSLDHGREDRFPEVSDVVANEARGRARDVAYRAGVKHISAADIAVLAADPRRTLYRFDVRTPEEHAEGHPEGFVSAPGGQLVQETDMAAPVRGARIVLFDPRGVRADMTGSWLAQMGWETYVVDETMPLTKGPRKAARPAIARAPTIRAEALAAELAGGAATLVYVGSSKVYGRSHPAGAHFVNRSRLGADLAGLPAKALVFMAEDADLAHLAAVEAGGRVFEGGTAAWAAAGLAVESGLAGAISPPDDVYRRPYEGADHDPAAMQAYLDWEFGLVDQLKRDGTHGFTVI
ncbi:rhodanese-like domain-containing protein [Phenylobacterium immobile]|uniref:rhodanese-like domain-containing protein n=1 Tax=Phenylobacterium immobile TaxID=21 RepID=UPI000A8038B4|nr:rhodanese-like domain-containing protein [Phenylobacterium immobile]